MSSSTSKLTRVAVFFDGGYFYEVGNYYRHQHLKQARLSIRGLLNFIRHYVQKQEEVSNYNSCQIIESHYFRGRFSAAESVKKNMLENQAAFDDVLISEGVIQHYLPIYKNQWGDVYEKGIDVCLALEAFDIAVHKHLDVVALVVSDGDYVPLVRKLTSKGTRSVVLGWDVEYEYQGKQRSIHTSKALLEVCTYPLHMEQVIEERGKDIKNLFVGEKGDNDDE